MITNDTNFGELVVRDGLPRVGMILLRLRSVSLSVLQARIDDVLAHHSHQLERFFTAGDDGVRVR